MIYLDFDGHTITGTAWNASKGVDPVNVSAYDTDGDPANFSTAEQDVVHEVWARVAEDYAAFDVDVTTQEPPQEAIDRAARSDEQYGTRVLIDPDTWYQSGCGCGGVAYIGVYDNAGQHDYYQPALVFTKGVGTGAKNLAEAASHEAGHNVGLGHDGTASVGYYEGHGAWAPIMGVGYYRGISQWSKGEYSGANNTEDDYSVIGSHGLALRSDEAGDTTDAAAALAIGGHRQRLHRRRDPTRTSTASTSPLPATTPPPRTRPQSAATSTSSWTCSTPAARSLPQPTLPRARATPVRRPVSARLSPSNLQPGTYYLRIDNVGYGNPLNTGYSTYGSRGAYAWPSTRPEPLRLVILWRADQPQARPDPLSRPRERVARVLTQGVPAPDSGDRSVSAGEAEGGDEVFVELEPDRVAGVGGGSVDPADVACKYAI